MKVPRRFANRKVVPPESPLTWEGPSRSACLGLYVATRDDPTADVKPFRNRERVMEALDYGFLQVADTVKVGARVTTAGRFLVGECLPEALRPEAGHGPCTGLKISAWLERILHDVHVEVAARCAEALERLGRRFVDGSGVSFSIGHLATPDASHAHVSRGRSATLALLEDVREGNITDGERYQKTLDVWSVARDLCHKEVRARRTPHDPVVALREAFSKEAPADDPCVMLGPVTKQGGEPFDSAVLHSRGEGLTAHEYAMTCRALRQETLAGDERARVAGELFDDLFAVLGEVQVTSRDCGASEGVTLWRPSEESSRTLAAHLAGRILADDVVFPLATTLMARPIRGTRLTYEMGEAIEQARVAEVRVRDPQGCLEAPNVCATCFGLDPEDGTWPSREEPVGARAAEKISKEARGFISHEFHIC